MKNYFSKLKSKTNRQSFLQKIETHSTVQNEYSIECSQKEGLQLRALREFQLVKTSLLSWQELAYTLWVKGMRGRQNEKAILKNVKFRPNSICKRSFKEKQNTSLIRRWYYKLILTRYFYRLNCCGVGRFLLLILSRPDSTLPQKYSSEGYKWFFV